MTGQAVTYPDQGTAMNEQAATELAELVQQIVNHGLACRFGDKKVYIASIWDRVCETYEADDVQAPCTLGQFKSMLLTWNCKRVVTLARADYPRAMDKDLLARSHIHDDLGEDFHFVLDPTCM